MEKKSRVKLSMAAFFALIADAMPMPRFNARLFEQPSKHQASKPAQKHKVNKVRIIKPSQKMIFRSGHERVVFNRANRMGLSVSEYKAKFSVKG